MRYLPNNLKPATHFIEVYNGGTTGICGIKNLDYFIRKTESMVTIHTICVFKIRSKCK